MRKKRRGRREKRSEVDIDIAIIPCCWVQLFALVTLVGLVFPPTPDRDGQRKKCFFRERIAVFCIESKTEIISCMNHDSFICTNYSYVVNPFELIYCFLRGN